MLKIGKALLGVGIFLVSLLPAVYINRSYGYFPALCLLLSFCISVACLQVIRRKLSIEAAFETVKCERGSSVSAGVNVVNHSCFVCTRAVANLFISDLFGADASRTRTYFTLAPKTKAEMGFDLDMPHVGVYHVGLKEIQLYDYFGFVKKSVPITGDFQVYVLPKLRTLEEIQEREEVLSESNQDTRTTVMNGMDYVGVRDYEMGDSMKQIHWKLSAHSIGYLTKLQESSRQMDFAVVCDFAAEGGYTREQLMDLNDCLIETSLSVLEAIAKHHTSYSLLYCNKEKQMQRTAWKGREQDIELLQDFSVITPEPGADYPDACQILQDESRMANKSTNVIVCTSRVTDQLLVELQKVKRQRRNPQLYYIVPAEENSRQLEAKRASLQQLEEAGIGFYFVSTEENLRAESAETVRGRNA